MPLTTDARSSRGGRRGTQRARFALYLCLGFVSACTAVSNFGHFHFGSDAGPAETPPEPDAGDGKPYGCTPSSDRESDCGDRVDNDCDEREDCDDTDCAGDTHCCKPNEIPEVSCSGGVDNDCDGLIDCEDPNCASSESCCSASGPEVGTRACTDHVDNDCDGVVDCDETSCAAQSACCNASGDENDQSTCMDGQDNDCDGKKDCADPDCAGVSECCTKSEPVELSCGDAKDNDCDGNADCRDTDCENLPICTQCKASEEHESNCSDLKDNDCDRDRDCLDPDCETSLACCVATGPEQGEGACSDDKDNDCDGLTDCKDNDCNTSMDCCQATGSESGDSACSDGKDNDCDGLTDCDDDACSNAQHCCVRTGDEVGTLACNDGIDNDCNNEKDCGDRKCGMQSSCCVASGTETSQPNDGKDNDCNGAIDIAAASMTVPAAGQPVAGNEVAITMVPSVIATATLECNTRRVATMGGGSFRPCPMEGNTIKPFTDTAAADPTNDGAWATDVRWNFGPGGMSDPFSFRYYIHHTLYNLKHCDQPSDGTYFEFAKKRLGAANVFRPGTDTALAGPFVHVTYSPLNANAVSANFFQDGTSQTVDMWSLRRRFALDPENKFLLITRNYVSSRYGGCQAAVIRFHLKSYVSAYYCDAVVLNRAGAGVCINNNSGTLSFGHDSNDPLANKLGWPQTNKFMWRQLVDAPVRGKVPDNTSGYQWEENLGYHNFFPKCTSAPCKNKAAIYLPDRAFFP